MEFDLTSAAIKQKARESGFDLVGIAPATASGYRHYFEQWIGDGKAGEFHRHILGNLSGLAIILAKLGEF